MHIYDTDTARLHTQSGLTDAFRGTIAVKQVCPMTPNLFGLYFDDLQAALQTPQTVTAPC